MLDLSQGFFKRLAESFEDPVARNEGVRPTQTIELPLTEEMQETTGREKLDTADLRSLRKMFLLLDEWDRAMQEAPHGTQNSSEECEIAVDT
jgi:hypothetical protein